MSISIKLNGQLRTAPGASPDTPLLYVLRNDFALNAAKYGCGAAQCGACTVLVDGKPVRSCVTPVSAVVGRAVTTVEGLGTTNKLSALQKAFIEEQAAQCGYCVAGMIMSATALLETNKHPSESEIRAALSGNLCRCGTHGRIIRAIQRAAGDMS